MSEESMGGQPEMENEESSNAVQEETSEFSPEKRQEWEELKKKDAPFPTLRWGQENNVPQAELESYLAEAVQKNRAKKIYGSEYALRRILNKISGSERWGTEEEIQALGEQVYQEAVEADALPSILTIAEVLYGAESIQYQEARDRTEALLNKEKAKLIEVPTDVSIADFFETANRFYLDRRVNLEKVLWDNFDEDLAEALESNKHGSAKILEIFTGFGYSKEDVEARLPVKFV